jgi:hypothetical protein
MSHSENLKHPLITGFQMRASPTHSVKLEVCLESLSEVFTEEAAFPFDCLVVDNPNFAMDSDLDGFYQFLGQTSEPASQIYIRETPSSQITFLHEIAHRIDCEIFGSAKPALYKSLTTNVPNLIGVAKKTKSITALLTKKEAFSDFLNFSISHGFIREISPGQEIYECRNEYLNNPNTILAVRQINEILYALREKEIFARCFTQFITEHLETKSEIKAIFIKQKDIYKDFPEYWIEEDFLGIKKTLIEIFQASGWLTR